MKKLTTYLGILTLCVTASVAAALIDKPGEAAYYVTIPEAKQAADDDQLIAVKFYTDW